MSQHITILQSFEHGLDELHPDHGTNKTYIKPSSKSTAAAPIPDAFIHRSADEYISRANQVLQELAKDKSGRLDNHIAARESPFSFVNEQQVVTAARLYLINPINITLGMVYEEPIECIEEQDLIRLRVDMAWGLHLSQAENELQKNENEDNTMKPQQRCGTRIALLEYKRRGYINRDQFEFATLNVEEADFAQEVREQKRKNKNKPLIQEKSSAESFCKQAAAYAIRSKCRFVGLFDWNSMYLIDFHKLQGDDIGSSAYLSHVPNELERKALLGFLIRACDDAGLKRRSEYRLDLSN